MAFRVPTMNLQVNLFRTPAPIPGMPTAQFMANLSVGRRNLSSLVGGFFFAGMTQPSYLLCPKLTDIRPELAVTPVDIVEVPAFSGRYFYVCSVLDVAKGFPNEYREAEIMPVNVDTQFGLPYPGGIPNWPQPTP